MGPGVLGDAGCLHGRVRTDRMMAPPRIHAGFILAPFAVALCACIGPPPIPGDYGSGSGSTTGSPDGATSSRPTTAADSDPDSSGRPDPPSTDSGPMSGVDSGASSSSTTNGKTSGSGEPTPDYGPCPCERDQSPAQINGVDGCYCAPMCSDRVPCPRLPQGEGMAACLLVSGRGAVPDRCVVICQRDDVCPFGGTCTPTLTPGVNICTHPDP